jgi:holo-[acyl-carrier protein] synthase
MIVGIGIDILDLNHMVAVCEKKPDIYKRILTAKEIDIYETRSDKRKIEFLAGRFAAKEAFSKAMGTGIGKTVNFQNVSVLNDEKGCPYIAESPFDGNVFISISHSKEMAAAQVVLEAENGNI